MRCDLAEAQRPQGGRGEREPARPVRGSDHGDLDGDDQADRGGDAGQQATPERRRSGGRDREEPGEQAEGEQSTELTEHRTVERPQVERTLLRRPRAE
ncbi:hypothetical protein GCM10023204_31580 [Actinomycetospora succinea]